MEYREFEVMRNYYYGESKTPMIWSEEFNKLDQTNVIRKIYEIKNTKYNETWYVVRDNKEASYILKNRCGNEYAIDIMKLFKEKYDFYTINSDVIEIFDDGYFPIVFHISKEEFLSNYVPSRNMSKAFFNNYYCNDGSIYKCIREYRNKVQYEEFSNELDAIYWCYHIKLSKKSVLNINKNNDLYYCVYEVDLGRRRKYE